MPRKLFTLVLCLVATAFIAKTQTQTPPDNEIWYTTTDGKIAELEVGEEPISENGEDFEIVSHTYENGRGVVRANKPIKVYGDWDQECVYHECSVGFWLRGEVQSVILPRGLIIIGEYAFAGCSSLTSITIPDSVTKIGNYAFSDCYALKDVNINITDLAKYCTNSHYVICKIPGNNHLFIDNKEITELVIPDSVTKIESAAFIECSSLTSVTIPDSVTEIGGEAFAYCSSIKSITIPDSVTSIESAAFFECSSLTSVTIPNSVTEIGYGAFAVCGNLKSFYGKFASDNGRCLINNGTLISFASAGLTEYIIPDSVTSIEYGAFFDCSSLTSITIPDGVTEVGEGAFSGCSSLTSIIIPNSVTEIGESAFAGCSSLTSITIPDSVTTIGEWTFCHCSSLTSVTIPNSVTAIGNYAFYNCSSLTSITIPNSVTEIGEYAFGECNNLAEIVCLAIEPPQIVVEWPSDDLGISEASKIYVPEKSVMAYKKSEYWSRYTEQIVPIK